MKSKKLLLGLIVLMISMSSFSLADQCSQSCVSTDPFEVAACLLECESN